MTTLLKIEDGYRIQHINGLYIPQRFSLSTNDWVNYYIDRHTDTSFKTERGAVNFLHIEWYCDLSEDEKEAHLKSGLVSDVLRKSLRRNGVRV